MLLLGLIMFDRVFIEFEKLLLFFFLGSNRLHVRLPSCDDV